MRQSLNTLHSSAQTRQLYADHRPWTQRCRRRGKPDAPRLDAEGKPKADACSYHVQARRRTRRAPAAYAHTHARCSALCQAERPAWRRPHPPSSQQTGIAAGAQAAGGAAAPLGRQTFSRQLARPPAPGRCSWSPTGRAWSARGGRWQPPATWRCPRAARAPSSWWTRAGAARGRSLGPAAPVLLRMRSRPRGCSRPRRRPGR